MQNETTPAEGKDSAQTESESALRGAPCSPSDEDHELNAARRPEGLRALIDGLKINPDWYVAIKAIRAAADKIEELIQSRDAARRQAHLMRNTFSESIGKYHKLPWEES